ncbi:clasp amine-terminal protein [Cystoisospora suis]|uniref:Clasp amine-terminal protein n=1 Tax=Cystoisospora suis TaxID=483139 RepID=A0A2C6LAH5_9APIC|nr:clasp amine-terminal protein [Cystoisospora suis]
MASPPGPVGRNLPVYFSQSGQPDISPGLLAEESPAQGGLPPAVSASQSLYRQMPFRRTSEGSPYLPPSTRSPFLHGRSPESPDKSHRYQAFSGAFSSPVATPPAARTTSTHGPVLTRQDQPPGSFASSGFPCSPALQPSFNQSTPLRGVQQQGTPPACSFSSLPPAHADAAGATTASATSATVSFSGSGSHPSLRPDKVANSLPSYLSPAASSTSSGYCYSSSATRETSYLGTHLPSVTTSNDQLFSRSTGLGCISPPAITASSPLLGRAPRSTAFPNSDFGTWENSPLPVSLSQPPCSPFVSPEQSSFTSPAAHPVSDPSSSQQQQHRGSRASNHDTPGEGVSSAQPPQSNNGTTRTAVLQTSALQVPTIRDYNISSSVASGGTSSCGEVTSANGFFFSSPVLTPSATETASARPRGGCIGASPNTPRRLMHSPPTLLPGRTTTPRLSLTTEERQSSGAHLSLAGGGERREGEDDPAAVFGLGTRHQGLQAANREAKYRGGDHHDHHSGHQQLGQAQQLPVHHGLAVGQVFCTDDYQLRSVRLPSHLENKGGGPILIANHCVPLQQTFSAVPPAGAPPFEYSSSISRSHSTTRSNDGTGSQQLTIACAMSKSGPEREQEDLLLYPEERQRLRQLQQLAQETQKKQQRVPKVQSSLPQPHNSIRSLIDGRDTSPAKQVPGPQFFPKQHQQFLLQRKEPGDSGYLCNKQEQPKPQEESRSHGMITHQVEPCTQQVLGGKDTRREGEPPVAPSATTPYRQGSSASFGILQDRQYNTQIGSFDRLYRGPVEYQKQGQQSETEAFQQGTGSSHQERAPQVHQLPEKSQRQTQETEEKDQHCYFRTGQNLVSPFSEDSSQSQGDKHHDPMQQRRQQLWKVPGVEVGYRGNDYSRRNGTPRDLDESTSRRQHEELYSLDEHLRKRQQVEAPQERERSLKKEQQETQPFQLKSSPAAAWNRAPPVGSSRQQEEEEETSCPQKDATHLSTELVTSEFASRRAELRDVQTTEQQLLLPQHQHRLRGEENEDREILEAADVFPPGGRGGQKRQQTHEASAIPGTTLPSFSSGSVLSPCGGDKTRSSHLTSSQLLRNETGYPASSSCRDLSLEDQRRQEEAIQGSPGRQEDESPSAHTSDPRLVMYRQLSGTKAPSLNSSSDSSRSNSSSHRISSHSNSAQHSSSSTTSSKSRHLSADLVSSGIRSCMSRGEGGASPFNFEGRGSTTHQNKRSTTQRNRDGGLSNLSSTGSRHLTQGAPAAEPLRRAGTPIENMGLSVTERNRRGMSRQHSIEDDAKVTHDKTAGGRSLKCLGLFSGGVGQKRSHHPSHFQAREESPFKEKEESRKERGGGGATPSSAATSHEKGRSAFHLEGGHQSSGSLRVIDKKTGSGFFRDGGLLSSGGGRDGKQREGEEGTISSSRELKMGGLHSEGMIWSQGGERKVESPSSADRHMTYLPSKDENCIMEEEHEPTSRSDGREGKSSLSRRNIRDIGGSDCTPNEAYDVDMKASSTACITSATEVTSRDMGGSEGVVSPVEGPTTSFSRSSRDDRPIGGGGAALRFFQTLQEEDTALQFQGRRPLQTTGSRNKPNTGTPLSYSQKSIPSIDGRARSIPRARPGGGDAALSGEGTSMTGGQLWSSGGVSSVVTTSDSAGTTGGQQPRKLFASQSSAIGRGVRYLTHDQLEPFDDPPSVKFIQDVLLPRLEKEATKGDWVEQVESLETLRRLAKYHMVLLTNEVLRRAVGGALAWLASPRSAVAKNACLTLADLFFFGQQRLDVTVHEVVEVCMKKCSQSNEFLNEAVKAVLAAVCQYASESRVASALLHSIPTCKQQGARSVGAVCMALLFQRSGTNATRLRELPQMVSLLNSMATEASPDVRAAARVALAILSQSVDTSLLRRSGVSLEALHKMEGFVSRTTAREIDDVMRSAALGFGASFASGGGSLSSSLSSLPDDRRTGTRIRGGG